MVSKMVNGITAIIPTFNSEISIGSIVIEAKKHVDTVIVIDEGSTDKTAEIANLAGADIVELIDKRRGTFKSGIDIANRNGTKIIVTIGHDKNYITSQTIDSIPDIVENIKNNDFDIVVSKNGKDYKNIKLLAFSIKSLKNLNSNFSSIKDILDKAEKNNLKIKYLNYDNKNNFDFNAYNIGVVVPTYNEEILIGRTIKGIPPYVKKIYIIDDGSTDNTYLTVNKILDPRISYIKHENNRGVGSAIVTGYKLALEDNMDIVAVMAGDDQMNPEELPKLLKPIIENRADYTKGNRLINKDFRKGMSKWRRFGNASLTMITKIGSGYWHVMDPQNGYTAISRQALEAMDLDSIYTYYGYCNDILIKLNILGMRVEDVSIPARYGEEKSKIKYSRYIVKVGLMIFRGFLWRLKIKYMILDFHPLVFFYFASMILLPFGMIFGIWIFIQKWYHNAVSQNYPLLTVFITLMGLQFLLFAMLFDMQAEKK